MTFPRSARRLVPLLLLVVTLFPASCQRQAKQSTENRPYLVLFAFNEEGKQISMHMTGVRPDRQLGRGVLLGEVGGKPIVLAETGVGMTNAAMTTQRMLDTYHPRAVIFTGIAGAVDSSMHIGDIAVPKFWKQHDYGYYGADGFSPNSPSAYSFRTDSLTKDYAFQADARLLSIVDSLSHDSLGLQSIGDRKPSVRIGGLGVSGNSFIDSKDKRDWLASEFQAEVTDMESAAVAQVCSVNGVPFIIFRSASDLAGGSGSETAHGELDQFFKVAAINSSTLVIALLETLDNR